MDLQQVSYFLVLAEAASFSEASESLFISRQGLSKTIARLEKELGVSLFTRSANGVRLTEAGRIFLRHARRLCREYTDVLEDLAPYTERDGSGTGRSASV